MEALQCILQPNHLHLDQSSSCPASISLYTHIYIDCIDVYQLAPRVHSTVWMCVCVCILPPPPLLYTIYRYTCTESTTALLSSSEWQCLASLWQVPLSFFSQHTAAVLSLSHSVVVSVSCVVSCSLFLYLCLSRVHIRSYSRADIHSPVTPRLVNNFTFSLLSAPFLY